MRSREKGLSQEETGLVLGTSLATTMRGWQAARAWLFSRLTRDKADGGSL